jgi:hypothetical protein
MKSPSKKAPLIIKKSIEEPKIFIQKPKPKKMKRLILND